LNRKLGSDWKLNLQNEKQAEQGGTLNSLHAPAAAGSRFLLAQEAAVRTLDVGQETSYELGRFDICV
jgi:hypothetical protein